MLYEKDIDLYAYFNVPRPEKAQGYLTAFALDKYPEHALTRVRPAMVVLPGGGYWMCSQREGEPIALAYLSHGFQSFYLRYTTASDSEELAKFPTMLIEAAMAVAYVRINAKKYGVEVGLIPCADGGTSLDQWKEGGLLYDHAVYQARLAQRTSTIAGVLWHQGESDAMVNASEAQHYGNLEYLIRGVREATGESELPFVMGDFVQHWKNSSPEITAQCLPVVNAMRRICADMGGEFVESDGLISNAQNPKRPDDGFLVDTIHFCRESSHELGQRYFAGWQKIAKRD
jgi:hypothetical protein